MHHIAFAVSQAIFAQTVERDERGPHSGVKDRGFMDSITSRTAGAADRAGVVPPSLRSGTPPTCPRGAQGPDGRDDYNIGQEHLADAIEALVRRSRPSLSDDRTPSDPYS